MRSIRFLQEKHAEGVLDDLNLYGYNWWLLIRDELMRAFTTRRSAIYRKRFGFKSHKNPAEKFPAARQQTPLKWHSSVLTQNVELHSAASLESLNYDKALLGYYSLFKDYNELDSDQLKDRIGDPIIEELNDTFQVVKLSLWNEGFVNYRTRHTPILLKSFKDSIQVHHPQDIESFRVAFKGLISICNEAAITHFLDFENVVQWIRRIVFESENWITLFKQIPIKGLLLSSFHTRDRMPLLLACRRMNISVCDIQHGFIAEHSLYAALGSTLPRRAQALLPEYFWTWNALSSSFLERSLELKTDSSKRILCLGNPSYLKVAPPRVSPKQMGAQRLRMRKRVLIVHQPDLQTHGVIPQLLPPHLWEVMASFPKNYHWLLRLHPRSFHLREEFENAMRSYQIPCFDVELPSQQPLATLLPTIDCVLTSYSTVALQAADQGIPIIIIDQVGKDMMEYVPSPPIHFGLTVKALSSQLRVLESTIKPFSFQWDCPMKSELSTQLESIF